MERRKGHRGLAHRRPGRILFDSARRVPSGSNIVEIGSHRGRSTILLARGKPEDGRTRIQAVDPFFDPRWGGGESSEAIFRSNLRDAGVDSDVNVFHGTSEQALQHWKQGGIGPYRVYLLRILPTLNRSHPLPENQSLTGFLLRVTHRSHLPRGVHVAVILVQAGTGISLLILLWLRRQQLRRCDLPMLCASATALVGWFMIFSPLSWDHYPLYIAPLWRWLCYRANGPRLLQAVILLSVAAMAFPLPPTFWPHLPEPLMSYMLWAELTIICFAAMEIRNGTRSRVNDSPPPFQYGAYAQMASF